VTADVERFFFVHLQKTAGTALFQRLRHHFGSEAVYPNPDDQTDIRSTTDVDFLLDRYRQHGDAIRVVTGHFPLCTVELLDAPFTTFTVLRDPVERTLSSLRRRQKAEERFSGGTLEQIYDDPSMQDIIRNHMVKMLSLTTGVMTSVPLIAHVDIDDEHLEIAKRNLIHGIDVFGLQTHFENFCADLESRFGWDLGPPRFANRTDAVLVPDDLRVRIAADNRFDMELYEFARESWEKQRGDEG
jgi:hypothetical protein